MTLGKLDTLLDRLIGELATKVKPEGFVRRQNTLRLIADGNAALINFQKSDQSSEHRLIFTINLGSVCGALLDVERVGVERANIVDSHLRVRLGMLLEKPSDKWWDLTESTDLAAMRDDLFLHISQCALPFLKTYLRADALVDLWRSGKSPGLTATQRSRFLVELENEIGKK